MDFLVSPESQPSIRCASEPSLLRYVIHNAIREEDMLLDTRPWGNYLTDYRHGNRALLSAEESTAH